MTALPNLDPPDILFNHDPIVAAEHLVCLMSILVRTVSEQAYEIVREQILKGDLAGGIPLRQDAMAEELGVSKIPVREAMSRLEQDGLLTSIPNRGYFVRDLDLTEAEEIFELRGKLEPEAAARAARLADEDDRAEVRNAYYAMESEPAAASLDYVLLNRIFHTALIRPKAGLITRQLVERLHLLAERYVRVHLEPQERGARASAEHAAIVEAWLARDAGQVSDLMQAHIEQTLQDVRQQLSPATPGDVSPTATCLC